MKQFYATMLAQKLEALVNKAVHGTSQRDRHDWIVVPEDVAASFQRMTRNEIRALLAFISEQVNVMEGEKRSKMSMVYLQTDEVCAKLADVLAGLARNADAEDRLDAAAALDWLRDQIKHNRQTAYESGNNLLTALVASGKTL